MSTGAQPTPIPPTADPLADPPETLLLADPGRPEDISLLDDLRVVLTRRDLAAPAPQPPECLEGRQIGPYVIGGLLGEGGLARVYRAADPAGGEPVAVKVLKPQYRDDERIRTRFEREARSMQRLRHPHVVPVFDFHGGEELQAIIMAYMPGGTVRDRVSAAVQAATPLPIGLVVRMMTQAAAGVGAAHELGVVHRDLKPSNLLLESGGAIRVADFGAILMLEGTTWLTGVGQQIGTPEYMSPEQCRGERVTTASDIYSLGVTLFELLTGHLPFETAEASPFAIMLKHISEPAPDPRRWREDVPHELAAVTACALSKGPQERYPSAAKFAEALLAAATAPAARAVEPGGHAPGWQLDVIAVRGQLQRLTQRAIVCWACRCARRVQKFNPDPRLERALTMAEDFTHDTKDGDSTDSVSRALSRIRGLRVTSLEAAYARTSGSESPAAVEAARAAAAAAACAAALCLEDAAADAAFAARSAVAALTHARTSLKPFWSAARGDYQRLVDGQFGEPGTIGHPIPRDYLL